MGEGAGTGSLVRRNLPGTKAAEYSRWREETFEEMDSTLAVQQYIQQTIRRDPTGKLLYCTAGMYYFDLFVTSFYKLFLYFRSKVGDLNRIAYPKCKSNIQIFKACFFLKTQDLTG